MLPGSKFDCHSIAVKSITTLQDSVVCMSMIHYILCQMRLLSADRAWRAGVSSDRAFLSKIRLRINPKAPFKALQMCDCCRGVSAIMRQQRHAQLPLPMVVRQVASATTDKLTGCIHMIYGSMGM